MEDHHEDGQFCIDVILTNQSNFVLDCSMHPSLHSIVTINIYTVSLISNLSIHHLTNVSFGISKNPIAMSLKKLFKESIGTFCFSENNIHDKGTVFNQTLMNVFSNFITNKLIDVDDRDPPFINEN